MRCGLRQLLSFFPYSWQIKFPPPSTFPFCLKIFLATWIVYLVEEANNRPAAIIDLFNNWPPLNMKQQPSKMPLINTNWFALCRISYPTIQSDKMKMPIFGVVVVLWLFPFWYLLLLSSEVFPLGTFAWLELWSLINTLGRDFMRNSGLIAK